MLCQAKGKSHGIGGILPHAADIFVRTHIHGVEPVQTRSVIEKMVVVHGLCHEISGTGFFVQLHQLFRVEIFRLPKSADILIAKLGRMTVVADVIEILGTSLHIHIAGVPVTAHGHALGPPMAPDTKLGITEPVGALIRSQGFKCGLKHERPPLLPWDIDFLLGCYQVQQIVCPDSSSFPHGDDGFSVPQHMEKERENIMNTVDKINFSEG